MNRQFLVRAALALAVLVLVAPLALAEAPVGTDTPVPALHLEPAPAMTALDLRAGSESASYEPWCNVTFTTDNCTYCSVTCRRTLTCDIDSCQQVAPDEVECTCKPLPF